MEPSDNSYEQDQNIPPQDIDDQGVADENNAPDVENAARQYYINGDDIKDVLTWDDVDGCLATDQIVVYGHKVGYMYREEPNENSSDSGWRFFAGDEDDDYLNNPDNIGIYRLNTIANYDQDIIPLLTAPYGSAFRRNENGSFVEEKIQ